MPDSTPSSRADAGGQVTGRCEPCRYPNGCKAAGVCIAPAVEDLGFLGNSVDGGMETVFTVGVPETTTHTPSNRSEKEATMAAVSTSDFLAQRAEWVALGRPADHAYARQCAEVYAASDGPAVAVRSGDTYKVFEL